VYDIPVELQNVEKHRTEINDLETAFLDNRMKPKDKRMDKGSKRQLEEQILEKYNDEINRLTINDPTDKYDFGDRQKLINRRDEWLSRYNNEFNPEAGGGVDYDREVVETAEKYIKNDVEYGYHYNDHEQQKNPKRLIPTSPTDKLQPPKLDSHHDRMSYLIADYTKKLEVYEQKKANKTLTPEEQQALRYDMYLDMAEYNDMVEDDHENLHNMDQYKYTKEIQAKLHKKLTARKFQERPDVHQAYFTTKSGGIIFDKPTNPETTALKQHLEAHPEELDAEPI
jgi:hypothetical protein